MKLLSHIVGVLLLTLWWTPLRAQAPGNAADSASADSLRRRLIPIGYGEQRAGDVTGAVTQVGAAHFNTGRIVSPEQLIQSTVAGVQVVDNDEVGGAVAVRIRGAASLVAGGDPLYVIDGMPVLPGTGGGLSAGRDPLNFLNPGDIATITVLRGADASAIFGAAGAHGVVLITTKAGAGVRGAQIEYGTSASASSATKLPSVLNATQFAAAVATYAPGRVNMLGTSTTDWLGLVSRTGYGQEQNVSLAGAGRDHTYRLSLGYLDQDGVIRGSSTERLTLGVAWDQRLLSDRLDVKVNLKGARTADRFTPNGALGDAATMAPTQPVYDPNNTQGFATGYWDWSSTGTSASNPIAALNLATDHATAWRSIGNLQADLRMPFLEALRADVNLGYDVTRADAEQFAPSSLADQTRLTHGYLNLANPSRVTVLLEGYLGYAAPLGVVPGSIDVTAGYSYAPSRSEYPAFSEQGLTSNVLGDAGIPPAATVQNTKSVVDGNLTALFARLGYNLADRYLATVSVRRDRSSYSVPDGGSKVAWRGTSPSIALAWRLSQEPWLRGVTALSDLKLRASWTNTVDQSPASVLVGPNLPPIDPNLQPQATRTWAVGLDYGLLRQRFTGSVDWYTATTSNLIDAVPVASGPGFPSYLTTDLGSMRNRGVEASLSARILEGRANGLSWTADFTAAHNANTVLSLASNILAVETGSVEGGIGTTVQVLQPGQPVNTFLVCQQAYQNGKPVENTYVSGDSTVIGCISNARPYHNAAPSWILGHSSYLRYGRFDLSYTLRAYLGSWVYNNVASRAGYRLLSFGGAPFNMSTSVLATGFLTPQLLSDYFVQDASFLRMDNVTLGYTFPLGGRSVRLYAVVQNAFTITGYRGVDPIAGLSGIDDNLTPTPRIVTAGLDVRL